MDMESSIYVNYLVDLVREGKVNEQLIDDAVRRILRVKFELGLFDDPYKYCDLQREKEMVYNPEHQKVVLDMARKSIVLLKNDRQLLPLKKGAKRIGVIGVLAEEKNSPLGSWRIASDDNTAISVLEGLKKYGDFAYAKGPDLITAKASFESEVSINTTDKTGFADAVALAKRSDTVIIVLGEHGFQSGEGRSRAHLGLPGLQQELLEAVYKVNKNIVLVLMNGRPLAIPWAAEHIPAIVEAWQLGSQSGNAIAQVLFGDYNPSGKLPMTFPRSVGQCPVFYNHYNTGRSKPEEFVFWSHYIDEANEPLFPFGYGLSYSSFEYSKLSIDDSNSDSIKVCVTVTNTGSLAGEEVVQLYIHDRAASVARPVKELKGFEKIDLKADDTKTVCFELTASELGFYNNVGEFVVEPGVFDVMVGTSSVKGLSGSFEWK
jgi:beta-glucosidase